MWNKKRIEEKDIPLIISQGMEMVKQGNELVEQIRCIYKLENDNIIYMMSLLDYIDNLPQNKIIEFWLCQMVN